jgi:serine/threonine protein phosphatase PrpC
MLNFKRQIIINQILILLLLLLQDKHIMCEVPGTDGFVLLAVFDGHGGDGAAIYAEATLLKKLHATSNNTLFA